MRLFRPSEGDGTASERTKSWTRTGSLDDGSGTKNGEDDELNDEEDVSRHGDDATKTAVEELRREEWAIARESLALICLLQAAFILNRQPELRTRKQAGKGKRY